MLEYAVCELFCLPQLVFCRQPLQFSISQINLNMRTKVQSGENLDHLGFEGQIALRIKYDTVERWCLINAVLYSGQYLTFIAMDSGRK